MDHEKQLLNVRVANLETFMEAVCKRLKCLPDYNDSLPTKGNRHVIKKLDALLEGEIKPCSRLSDCAHIRINKSCLGPECGVYDSV